MWLTECCNHNTQCCCLGCDTVWYRRNVSKCAASKTDTFLPDYMASHPRRCCSSVTVMRTWESKGLLLKLMIYYSASVDRLTSMTFSLSEDELDRQAELFKQVCAQKLRTLNDAEDDVWDDREQQLTFQTVIDTRTRYLFLCWSPEAALAHPLHICTIFLHTNGLLFWCINFSCCHPFHRKFVMWFITDTLPAPKTPSLLT